MFRSKLTPTKYHSPCPICSDTSGDCRQGKNSQGNDLVLCHSYIDEDAAIAGWRYLKPTKDGIWGVYISSDDRESTPSHSNPRGFSPYTQKPHQKRLLSIAERDCQFRLLQRQAGHPATKHVRHLIEKRHLIQADIDLAVQQGWIWTWQGRENKPFGVTLDLPGIDSGGKLRKFAGFAIAALDPDGHITGLQIKTDRGNPKYHWIGSFIVGGNGPHLPSGELPLFCWKHPQEPDITEVWLCEGALKSLLVALFLWRIGRTDIAVIGTASAARYGYKTLQNYLERLGASDIRLMPDAGAVENKHITRANNETLDFCQRLGYQIQIGWWNQLTKDHLDIDELLAVGRGDEIVIITPLQFKSFSSNPEETTQNQQNVPSERTITKEEWIARKTFKSFQNLFNQIRQEIVTKNSATAPTEAKECLAIVPYKGVTTINYEPGNLPNFEEWVEAGSPKVIIQPGQRRLVNIEAKRKGFQATIDRSLVGTGKSHDSGLYTREDFDLIALDDEEKDVGGRIFVISADHKNPTTLTVEQNTEDLISRHDGETLDPSRRTPLGHPYRTRTPKGQHPDIPANCPETETFLIANQEKDATIFGGRNSPICQRCSLFSSCEFLQQRTRQLQSKTNLRAHPDSLGSVSKNDVAVVDEPGTLLNGTKTLKVTKTDIAQLMFYLEEEYQDEYALVKPFVRLVMKTLQNLKDIPKYGYSHIETLALLTGTKTDPAALEMWRRYQQLGEAFEHPLAGHLRDRIEEIAPTADPWIGGLDELEARLKSVLANNWHKILEGRQTPEEKQEAIKNYGVLNWLSSLLGVLSGRDKHTDIRINQHGAIEITRRSRRHARTLKGFGFVMFLDATADIEDLKRKSGIRHILEIEQQVAPDAFRNLTFRIVKGLGTNPKGTTADSTLKRYAAAIEGLIERTPATRDERAIIGYKGQLDNFPDASAQIGYWFKDTRGNNRFTSTKHLINFGLPKPNLAAKAAEWHGNSGDAVAPTELTGRYGAWYNAQVRAEIIQAAGRPRAHLRPNEQIWVDFLAGDAMTEWDIATLRQKFPGCEIEVIDAYDLAPSAASKGVQKIRGMVDIIWQLVQNTGDASRAALAEILKVNPSRVSQLAKEATGKTFRQLVETLVFLYKALKEKLTLSQLSDESRWVAETYLPLVVQVLTTNHSEAVEEVVVLLQSFGAKEFERILAATEPWVLCKLLGGLMQAAQSLLGESPPIARVIEASG